MLWTELTDLLVKEKHIFLDTCVFINGFKPSSRQIIQKAIDYLVDTLSCALITISPVYLEFVKGADELSLRNLKTDYFNQIVSVTIPLSPSLIECAREISVVYRRAGSKLSITDLFLAGTLKQFRTKAFLLTKNHSDFPTGVFDRECAFHLESSTQVESYAFYQFNEKKYTGVYVRILEVGVK